MAQWFAVVGGVIGLTSSIAYGAYSLHAIASRPPLPPGVAECGNCIIGGFVAGELAIVGSPVCAAALALVCGSVGVLCDLVRPR